MKNSNTPKLPKKVSNGDLWDKEFKKLKRRMKNLTSKGVKVDFSVTKPNNPTKRQINQIKSISATRILKGVFYKQIKIQSQNPTELNFEELEPQESENIELREPSANTNLTIDDIENRIVKEIAEETGLPEEEVRKSRDEEAKIIEQENAKEAPTEPKKVDTTNKGEKVSKEEKEEQWKAYWRMKNADPSFDPDDEILSLFGRENFWNYVDGRPEKAPEQSISVTDEPLPEPDEPTGYETAETEDIPKETFSGTYYVDSETGEYFTENNREIYEKDKKGRIKVDENGRPIIKDKYIQVVNDAMTKEEYDQLTMDMLKEKYLSLTYSSNEEVQKRSDAVVKFIDELLTKYTPSQVREAYDRAAEAGFEITFADIYAGTAELLAFKLERIALELGDEALDIYSSIAETLMQSDEESEDWEDIL